MAIGRRNRSSQSNLDHRARTSPTWQGATFRGKLCRQAEKLYDWFQMALGPTGRDSPTALHDSERSARQVPVRRMTKVSSSSRLQVRGYDVPVQPELAGGGAGEILRSFSTTRGCTRRSNRSTHAGATRPSTRTVEIADLREPGSDHRRTSPPASLAVARTDFASEQPDLQWSSAASSSASA